MTVKKSSLLLSIPAVLLPALSLAAAPVNRSNAADLRMALSSAGDLRLSESAGQLSTSAFTLATDNNNNNNNNNGGGGTGGGAGSGGHYPGQKF